MVSEGLADPEEVAIWRSDSDRKLRNGVDNYSEDDNIMDVW